MQDTKKVQTLINKAAAGIEAARELEAIRALYATANPSLAGTPLSGKKALLNTFFADLDTLLNSEAANLLVNSKVASHRGTAL